MADSCKHGNKPSGFIKGDKFLHYLSDYQFLKDSAAGIQLISKRVYKNYSCVNQCHIFVTFLFKCAQKN
jgi:hypothetical protein